MTDNAKTLIKGLMRACMLPDNMDNAAQANYALSDYVGRLEAVVAAARALDSTFDNRLLVWKKHADSMKARLAMRERLAALDALSGAAPGGREGT